MATISSQLQSVGQPKLKRTLGTPALVLFGMAYMVPLAAFTTYGIVTDLTRGKLPLAYLVTLAVILFTASSYGKIVQVYPNAGSSYAYATRSFGAKVGFVSGWGTLIDYLLLPMVCYLLIGIYMGAAFPSFPVWIWILIALVCSTAINILGTTFMKNVNTVLIVFQFVFMAIFLAMAVFNTTATDIGFLIEPFTLHDSSVGLVVSGAAILCFSFLGFDAISTMVEEATEPKKTVPRAIMLAPIIAGTLFILVSYGGHLVHPDWQSFTDLDSAALNVVGAAGGKLLTAFFTAAYVGGCFAASVIAQASASRILFSMGRDELLPNRIFGHINRRFQTPTWSIIIVAAFSLLALILSLDYVSSIISFGALVAFTIVNFSVVKTYGVDKKHNGPVKLLSHIIIPLVGGILTLWLWTSLSTEAFLTGVIWMTIGGIWLSYKTRFFTKPTPELQGL